MAPMAMAALICFVLGLLVGGGGWLGREGVKKWRRRLFWLVVVFQREFLGPRARAFPVRCRRRFSRRAPTRSPRRRGRWRATRLVSSRWARQDQRPIGRRQRRPAKRGEAGAGKREHGGGRKLFCCLLLLLLSLPLSLLSVRRLSPHRCAPVAARAPRCSSARRTRRAASCGAVGRSRSGCGGGGGLLIARGARGGREGSAPRYERVKEGTDDASARIRGGQRKCGRRRGTLRRARPKETGAGAGAAVAAVVVAAVESNLSRTPSYRTNSLHRSRG
jgi:hypothetical protein